MATEIYNCSQVFSQLFPLSYIEYIKLLSMNGQKFIFKLVIYLIYLQCVKLATISICALGIPPFLHPNSVNQ